MIRLFSLDILDIVLWREHDNRLARFLYRSVMTFVCLLTLMIAILLCYGLIAKEDIYIALDDFSITIEGDKNANEPAIYLTGIVPYDIMNAHSLSNAKFAKLYFSKEVNNLFKRTYVRILDINVKRFQSGMRTWQRKNDVLLVKEIDTGVLSARLSPKDERNIDLVPVLVNMKGNDNNKIKKAKIIFGESSLLEYWLKQLFSKNSIANAAGRLIQ